jgi:hypothetical protein
VLLLRDGLDRELLRELLAERRELLDPQLLRDDPELR